MLFTNSRGNKIEKPTDTPVLWRVAAYAVVWQNDKLLMVKSGSGLWILPGGGVEDGEMITDAMVRECAEETGYKVAITDSQPIYAREQPFYHTSSDTFYHSLQLFYDATLVSAEPDQSLLLEQDKARESAWVDMYELPEKSVHHTLRDLMKILKSGSYL